MRRRRATVALALVLGLLVAAGGLRAQSGIAKEGAVFLLVPVGARAVAQAQAATASRLGAEGIWWNPASLAWNTRREASVDHAANAFITGDAVSAVVPVGRAGVLGASLLYFNFGEQAATDEFGSTIGTLYARATVLASSYSATFGDRVSAGVTHKLVRQTQSCSGACQNVLTFSVSTSAFDLGAHAVVDEARRLTFGAAIRNFGFGLQTIDREQTDPLPTRIHLGATYRLEQLARRVPGMALDVSTEVVSLTSLAEPALRVGGEARFSDRVSIRGGILTRSADESSAAIGFGLRQGTLSLDFARSFGGASADAGSSPTYVTLRVGFR